MAETPTKVCPSCGGVSLYHPEVMDCETCNGEGTVPDTRPAPSGSATPTDCDSYQRADYQFCTGAEPCERCGKPAVGHKWLPAGMGGAIQDSPPCH